jgi:hypothetical protein
MLAVRAIISKFQSSPKKTSATREILKLISEVHQKERSKDPEGI